MSYTKSRAIAEASAKAAAGGSASIIIETSAGTATGTSAKATINASGGSAKIQSTSAGRGGESSSCRKRIGKDIVSSEKSIM